MLTNKKIHQTIREISGEEGIKIVEFLKNRKNISEFVIAEKTKLDMQRTRNVLYTLNNFNIAAYIRRKDRKKGWYISYWTFNRKRVKDVIEKIRTQKLEMLKDRLKREEENVNNFYICDNACSRLDFDQASEYEFKCPECGHLLALQPNDKTIINIRERIRELESEA
ncbi:MAG TPA: hypothetical protein VJI46_00905 [Candidatus Nanoarchaeia archaeon]|nr:hypothetical protein [Candidatus Nanoarchaeia archaeon]